MTFRDQLMMKLGLYVSYYNCLQFPVLSKSFTWSLICLPHFHCKCLVMNFSVIPHLQFSPIEFHYSHQGGTYLTCMQLAIKTCIFLGLIFFLKIVLFSIYYVENQNHLLMVLICTSTFNITNKPKIFPIRPAWISLHRPWNDLATW